MKNMLFMMVLFCVSSLAGQARNVNANSFPDFITFLRHHIAHNDNQRVT